jgi:flagellin-like protein
MEPRRTRGLDTALDGRGISPVIGTILVVALVVLLSAVVGAGALGIGGANGDPVPQAQLSVDLVNVSDADPANDGFRITHERGTTLSTDTIVVSVSGVVIHGQGAVDGSLFNSTDSAWVDGEITAGESFTLSEVGNVFGYGDVVRVTYEADGRTYLLLEREVSPPN